MSRCRICTANDREALIEDMARAMWETQECSASHTDYDPWERASPYWQQMFRGFAAGSLAAIENKVTYARP